MIPVTFWTILAIFKDSPKINKSKMAADLEPDVIVTAYDVMR